ncbi:hypothetical protein H5V45_00735 [Nocardioides sp. KIGAM211]|uniref:Uncharacterized protein n=1 Tax=Nocardioides luti TaxID=2761101 RepID=A0A7X0RCJ6_9ACTN|nr:hypothetical protein [Nocardioides luti]MBB6625833.1 hypothetical protein [Nocardioides luti]
MSAAPPPLDDLDPFDLPDWLGESEVTWTPDVGLRTGHHVRGRLTSEDGHEPVPCDLLAVDEAYPSPVADDQARLRAHQAWRHGQILLATYDGRLTLAVPGTGVSADGVLDALSRLAKAVGASPERYAARLRIGAESQRRTPRVP